MTGRFIALEGVDGSGKDTILHKLSSLFFTKDISRGELSLNKHKYHNFLVTYEPTANTTEGKKIYEMGNTLSLLPFTKQTPEKIADLYIKDRIKHSRLIQQVMKEGVTVICSRYDLSTYAYQMHQGCSFDYIYNQHLYSQPKGALIPDITLFLYVEPSVAIERIKLKDSKNKDNYDMDNLSMKSIALKYMESIDKLKEKQPNRNIVIIDASKTQKEVLEDCVKQIDKIFSTT